jgi:CheY-like chemotaxis protein
VRVKASIPKSKRTVLVIDDEKDITELISYNLTRHGYEVLNAFDAPGYPRLRRALVLREPWCEGWRTGM